MPTEQDYKALYDRIAALRETTANRLGSDLIQNPQLADALTKQIDDLLASVVSADLKATRPPDKGLAQLAGVGPEAAGELGKTLVPPNPTTRQSPPSASLLSATCTTSISTTASACFASCKNSRSCSEQERSVCRLVRARSACTSSTAAKSCAT